MEIILSKRFIKKAKKLVENKPNIKEKVNACIIDFAKNGRDSKYYRKHLRGEWYGYEELQIGGDIRIIIRMHQKKDQAVFEEIGTHAQLDF